MSRLSAGVDLYEAAYEPGDGTCDQRFKKTALKTEQQKLKALEHLTSIRYDSTMTKVIAIFSDASPNELDAYKGAAKKAFKFRNP